MYIFYLHSFFFFNISNEAKTILLFIICLISNYLLTLFDHILILSETDTIISLVFLTIKLYHLSNDACYYYLLLFVADDDAIFNINLLFITFTVYSFLLWFLFVSNQNIGIYIFYSTFATPHKHQTKQSF